MEAADRDRHAGRAERAGQVHGARELVRLDADQRDQRLAPALRIMAMIRSGLMRLLVSS